MSFLMAGSIYSYTQNLKLSQKWNMKKENGNYLQKQSNSSKQTENAQVSEFEQYREQLEQIREQNDPEKTNVYTKLNSGKKLSAQEMEYLRNHDPMSYQKAKEMEAERESYKRELKNCKTKEDVERLRTSRLAVRFAVANSISSNANIPKSVKAGLMAQELAKAQALDEETREFKKSLQYRAMPTDAEKKEEYEEKMDEIKGEMEVEREQLEKQEKDKKNVESEAESDFKIETDSESGETKEVKESIDLHKDTFTDIEKEMDVRSLKTKASTVEYRSSYGRKVYKQKRKVSNKQKDA